MEKLKEQLMECETMEDIFIVLQREYDLGTTQMGFGTKLLIVAGIVKAIKLLNPKKRK